MCISIAWEKKWDTREECIVMAIVANLYIYQKDQL